MGLAASQARLLSLTNRQHTIEAKAQVLQANKMRLANDSDKAYKKYLNALEDTSLKTMQINQETGASTWINGNINNLLRYETSDKTTGDVFFVQDLESGKLHIPEVIGNKYDIATDARNFAEQFGITYVEKDLNEDIKIKYQQALDKGWNNIMSESLYSSYINACNVDKSINALGMTTLLFIPEVSNGVYAPNVTQTAMAMNFRDQIHNVMGSVYYNDNTVFTAQERAVIEAAINLMDSVDDGMYFTDTSVGEPPYYYTKTTYTINSMSASITYNDGTTNTYVATDGEKYSETDKFMMMLNGGKKTYNVTQTVEEVIWYYAIPTVTENVLENSSDIYTTRQYNGGTHNDITILNNYGASTYGEALTKIFTKVATYSCKRDALLSANDLTEEDAQHYREFKSLKADFEAYVPEYVYLPSDRVKGPYYEQIYNAIKAAGGWIGASEGRAQNDTWVSNMIKNAQVILTTWDPENEMLSKTSAALNTSIKEVTDNPRIEKASQEYEADLDKINNKDASYDKILSQLESERSALTTEIDSLESVIKNNIDKHFKLMG